MVDKPRLNLSFFSKKVEKGRDKTAIRSARKRGANTDSPNFARNPNAIMLKRTKGNLTTNGIGFVSLMVKICLSTNIENFNRLF